MVFCIGREYVVANTLEETPLEEKATYFEPGQPPMGPVSPASHAVMDLVLVPKQSTSDVSSTRSIREATLAANHYLVACSLGIEYNTHGRQKRCIKRDRSALSQSEV